MAVRFPVAARGGCRCTQGASGCVNLTPRFGIARSRFLFLAYFTPTPASACRRFRLPPSTIVSRGSTNHILKSALIDFVALKEIDRSPSISCKAVVEQLVRIRKAGALSKGHLHLILVSVGHADQSIVRPTRTAHPFPLFNYFGVRIMNDFAKIRKHFAAPVRKVCDSLINKFRWVHWTVHTSVLQSPHDFTSGRGKIPLLICAGPVTSRISPPQNPLPPR